MNLGDTTSLEVLASLLPMIGTRVVDVGCGDMTFSRQLAAAGAEVLAVDPDPVQAALNRELPPESGITFIEAGAEALPLDRGAVDGVFFSFSLHHVPSALYPAVFEDVVRVLRPTGFLAVIEPTGCPLNEVMKLFHDEDTERAAARRAILELAVPRFESHVVREYHSTLSYDSFEAFAARFGNRSFNPGYDESDVRRPDVEAAFERAGGSAHRFLSPKRLDLLQHVRPAPTR